MSTPLPQPPDTREQSRGWLSSSLRWHALFFVLANGFLATINLVFSPSVLWFLWVTGTWGMGLVVHAFATLEFGKPKPKRVSRSKSSRRGRSRGRDHREERASESPPPSASDSGMSDAPTMMAQPGAPVSSDGPTQLHEGAAPTPSLRPPQRPSLIPAQRLAGRFLIERALGAGGMGEVYLARDETLGERVALKTIAGSHVTPAVLERFRREAQAARRITHPNVVRIHDIGQDGELAFLSMEYVEGTTLGQRIDQQSPLPLSEIKRVALQVCAGMQAAHASGVVHRDLKPDNILLDAKDQVRIIDFGLARIETSGGLTATGTVMGTAHYMAPEQLMGKSVDARTDIYAIGCVLYHAIVGNPPFMRDSAVAIGMAHCNDTPASLIEQRADVTTAWETLVMRALEKAPERRFENVDALRVALEAL